MDSAPRRVCKRDGRHEAFDGARLARSIDGALSAVDRSEPGRVEQIAAAVVDATAVLGGVASTEEIARIAEEALRGSSEAGAADRYREHGERRHRAVARLRVHNMADGEEESIPWSRERLSRSLICRNRLESSLSRRVARRVEQRILAAGLRHVTSALVARLAENEMRLHGLRSGAQGTTHLSPPREELHAWLSAGVVPGAGGVGPWLLQDGRDVRPALGGRLLGRFALEELVSPDEAALHRDGSIHLLGLDDWLRPLLLRAAPAPGQEGYSFWRGVASMLPCAQAVEVVWPRGRQAEPFVFEAASLLLESGQIIRLRTDDVRLAREWAALGQFVRLSAAAYLAAAPGDQEALRESGRCLLVYEAPSGSRRQTSQWDGAAVLNLARAASRCDRFEEPAFLESATVAAGHALRALRRLAKRRGMSAGVTVGLLPAGLADALTALYGDSRPRRRRQRLLLQLRENWAAEARKAGVRLVDGVGIAAESAGYRMARKDRHDEGYAYLVGWRTGDLRGLPDALDFDVAPYLEFPSMAADDPTALAQLLQPRANARPAD